MAARSDARLAGRAPERDAGHGALHYLRRPRGAQVAVLGAFEEPSWRVELGAELWFPRPATYPSLPNIGADVSLAAGETRICALPALAGVADVTFPVCAGGEVGLISVPAVPR